MAELTEYERLRLKNDVLILEALQHILWHTLRVEDHEGIVLHDRLRQRVRVIEEGLILRGESR